MAWTNGMERFIYNLIDIIMGILCVVIMLVSVFIIIFIALFPFYLMVRVSPWFVLIYIGYIFLIFIYSLLKDK